MFFRFWSKGLKVSSVHESPSHPAARDDRAAALRFVREGFSFGAAFLTPLWMISNGLWLVLGGYIMAIFGLIAAFGLAGINDYWLGCALVSLHLIIGFEADSLIRWTLDRRAWHQIAIVTGDSVEDCERRFFEIWLRGVPAVSTANLTPPGSPGGLETPTNDSTTKPLSGEVIAPKRTGWRSAMTWRQ